MSPRTLTAILLGLALIGGAWLRFANLGARELSADESASWAAAAAPTLGDVIVLQAQLNAGKLPIHDVVLHELIVLWGDGLPAMRALSAALGTLAIVLVFFVARELFELDRDGSDSGPPAAIGALVFAVNLVTIKYSREARMYPLLFAATLAQAGFLLRTIRLGGALNLIAAALLTALALGTHFSAFFVVATEGIWLIYWFWRAPQNNLIARRRAIAAFIALAVGVLMLAPLAPIAFRSSIGAVEAGELTWVRRPPIWEPIAIFNKATGTFAFPLLALLAMFGVVRGWRCESVTFALLWMWAPIAMLMAVSYAYTPLLLERYALSCFVPFFILVAVGIRELRDRRLRLAALALTVVLSLGHIDAYNRKPHDVQWREACAIAYSAAPTDGAIAVEPGYAVTAARYYLRTQERADVIPYRASPAAQPATAAVLVLADQGVDRADADALSRAFPHQLARLRGVRVLAR